MRVGAAILCWTANKSGEVARSSVVWAQSLQASGFRRQASGVIAGIAAASALGRGHPAQAELGRGTLGSKRNAMVWARPY